MLDGGGQRPAHLLFLGELSACGASYRRRNRVLSLHTVPIELFLLKLQCQPQGFVFTALDLWLTSSPWLWLSR